jgi:hypothetical protein
MKSRGSRPRDLRNKLVIGGAGFKAQDQKQRETNVTSVAARASRRMTNRKLRGISTSNSAVISGNTTMVVSNMV